MSAPGYLDFDTTLTLAAGDTVDLGQITLRKPPPQAPANAGLIMLQAVPSAAQISLGGAPVAVGQLEDFQVGPGQWRLRISAPGYVALDTTITVVAGRVLNLGQITLKTAP